MVSQISRLDIIFPIQSCLPMCCSCNTNLLVNIPFSLPQQSSPAVPYPYLSCVVRHRDSNDTAPGAFRHDLSNHAKMPHPGQSHNVVIYKSAYVKHDSRSGGCEFDLPNRPFLSPWSHFTRQTYSSTLWAAACVISLATQSDYTTGQALESLSKYVHFCWNTCATLEEPLLLVKRPCHSCSAFTASEAPLHYSQSVYTTDEVLVPLLKCRYNRQSSCVTLEIPTLLLKCLYHSRSAYTTGKAPVSLSKYTSAEVLVPPFTTGEALVLFYKFMCYKVSMSLFYSWSASVT